jgi:hypothetical protein
MARLAHAKAAGGGGMTPGIRPKRLGRAKKSLKMVVFTLVGTAELNGWDPQAYLRVLLERIADHPTNRIGELAPWILRPDAG